MSIKWTHVEYAVVEISKAMLLIVFEKDTSDVWIYVNLTWQMKSVGFVLENKATGDMTPTIG